MKSLARALGVTTDFLVGEMPRMSFDETLRSDETAEVIFRGYEKLTDEKRRQAKEYRETYHTPCGLSLATKTIEITGEKTDVFTHTEIGHFYGAENRTFLSGVDNYLFLT
jgi:hypothetical protein